MPKSAPPEAPKQKATLTKRMAFYKPDSVSEI
jgi:hypothetical protein